MSGSSYNVSVVIPALNAEPYLPELLVALHAQLPEAPHEIIVVDSGSSDRTIEIASADASVRIVTIEDFTHGRSRNLGAAEAKGDIVVFMTQDAMPRDASWLQELLSPFASPDVVAVSSRQVPKGAATPMERFFLKKRFPEKGNIRNLETLNGVISYEGILFSDVSCAVRRSILLEYPFDETLIMSEDQQLARDLISAGHTMVYAASSVVVHSHRYSLWQTFKRYFDSICALQQVFPDYNGKSSLKLGLSYIREELVFLARETPVWLFYYPFYLFAKSAATVMAHNVKHLPHALLKRISMHSYHWK